MMPTVNNIGKLLGFLLILTLSTGRLYAQQEHPLSRVDSADVITNLNLYQDFKGKNDLRSAADAINKVAFVYWNNNHYREAIRYYEISLDLNEKINNENGIAMINNNLGMLYSDVGNFERSLGHFRSTLAARKSNKEKEGIISAEVNMSVVLNNIGRYNESIDLLDDALRSAKELQDYEKIRSVYGMLSETHEKAGNVDESIKYFDLYRTFHEEAQRKQMEKVNQKLAEEKAQRQQVELEKARQENELLKKQLQVVQQEEIIKEQDSVAQILVADLDSAQRVQKILMQEAEIADLQAAAADEKNQQLEREKKYLANITTIIVITAVLLISLVVFIVFRIRKHNNILVEKNEKIEEQNEAVSKLNDELKVINKELVESLDELRKTKEKLVMSEKMASIGSVVGGIAHEINNSVNFIAGSSEMICNIINEQSDEIKKQMGEDFEVIEELQETIKSGIERTNSFISKIRSDVYKISKFMEVDLVEIVEKSLGTLKHKIDSKHINIIRKYPDTFISECIPEHIEQLFTNIIDNAIEAVEDGGDIQLNIEQTGETVSVTIKDDGVGIDVTDISKIYDPFFTTKDIGRGSGLGLYMAYSYVNSHNGQINVQSEKGVGSEFKISLPIVQEGDPVTA